MDACKEPAGKSANATKKEGPPSSQHLNDRGRIHNPSWKKAVVCDFVEESVKVENEKDVGLSRTSIVHVPR